MTPPPMIVTLCTSGMMSSWLSCAAECLVQNRLVQYFAEKLLWVPASRPVGWRGISEGEVTELHACTLLSRWDRGRARRQGLAHLQSHLDETPFQ
jgi:hypothetical protein